MCICGIYASTYNWHQGNPWLCFGAGWTLAAQSVPLKPPPVALAWDWSIRVDLTNINCSILHSSPTTYPLPFYSAVQISTYKKFSSNKFTYIGRIKTKTSYDSQGGVNFSFFSSRFFLLMHFRRNGANGINLSKTSPCNQHVKNGNMMPSYSKAMRFKIHKTLSLQLTMEFGCT